MSRKSLKHHEIINIISSEIYSKIKLIDGTIFPDNPLGVRLDKDTEFLAEASHHFDENNINNNPEHYYVVWEKGIFNKKLNERKNPKKDALRIALHEVRHRVQHDLKMKVRLLNLDDIKQFIVNEPKNALEKYFSSSDYKEFIDYAVKKSSYDFDAMITEDIAMNFLMGNYSDGNIKKISLDIVKQSAEVILKILKIQSSKI